MHRPRRMPIVLAVMLAADGARPGAVAFAGRDQPYQPVAVKLPRRRPIRASPRSARISPPSRNGRVFDRLARIVVARGFFWDRDFANGFDPKKSGVENLAAAIGLERGTGGGWQTLVAFADEPSASEISASPGVLCAPARPASTATTSTA